MKTKSVSSMAASFVVAVTLNLSAVAGPGPQLPAEVHKASKETKTVMSAFKAWTAPVAEKTAVPTRPQGSFAVGARGNALGL